MSVLNDDGLPLNLSVAFLFFLMPNFILIILTILSAYLVYLSKNRPQVADFLGELGQFFAKGALDRIIRNMLRHFNVNTDESGRQIPLMQQHLPGASENFLVAKKMSGTSSSNLTSENKGDIHYILLVPFQLDLLLTVFVYKILTRDVYPETCQSYLTTYHNRPGQVACWLKNTNRNISNISSNITLHQYCTNQTITYINYEHNDVICIQYVFKLINIIDTITNMFAWHQAIVFTVTKSIVFSYWYQHKLRKTSFWFALSRRQHRVISFTVFGSLLLIYIVVFVILLPVMFLVTARKRVDLTHHLVYACGKFTVAIIAHVNLYTLYQWYLLITENNLISTINKEQELDYDQSAPSVVIYTDKTNYTAPRNNMLMDKSPNTSIKNYLTPKVSV